MDAFIFQVGHFEFLSIKKAGMTDIPALSRCMKWFSCFSIL
jgi:hypothetical protein